MKRFIRRVLSIAGSDSGGGAGIQADLKTCAALNCYGMTAITALTAQNTLQVSGIHETPPTEVRRQIEAVLEDIGADAVKTGMLSNAAVIEVVASCLRQFNAVNIVVDPVMVSKSNAKLLQDEAVEALKTLLLPLATIITPNIPEATALTGIEIRGQLEIRKALDALFELGAPYVLLKGGHLESEEAADYLFDGDIVRAYSTRRIDTRHTHGTGCTYSAAIACCLAQGSSPPEAVRLAKDYLTGAILESDRLQIGKGVGPLHHGWNTAPLTERR